MPQRGPMGQPGGGVGYGQGMSLDQAPRGVMGQPGFMPQGPWRGNLDGSPGGQGDYGQQTRAPASTGSPMLPFNPPAYGAEPETIAGGVVSAPPGSPFGAAPTGAPVEQSSAGDAGLLGMFQRRPNRVGIGQGMPAPEQPGMPYQHGGDFRY